MHFNHHLVNFGPVCCLEPQEDVELIALDVDFEQLHSLDTLAPHYLRQHPHLPRTRDASLRPRIDNHTLPLALCTAPRRLAGAVLKIEEGFCSRFLRAQPIPLWNHSSGRAFAIPQISAQNLEYTRDRLKGKDPVTPELAPCLTQDPLAKKRKQPDVGSHVQHIASPRLEREPVPQVLLPHEYLVVQE